jgi:predicted Fe-Mo cluster-binding NifX family protein
MRICIPTHEDNGLSSTVCEHFGSAPWYVIVDSDTGASRAIANAGHPARSHGACTPLAALRGQAIDALVVGGIGAGALARLDEAGIAVYRADAATVAQLVRRCEAGQLARMSPGLACAGHGHPHGPCSHP